MPRYRLFGILLDSAQKLDTLAALRLPEGVLRAASAGEEHAEPQVSLVIETGSDGPEEQAASQATEGASGGAWQLRYALRFGVADDDDSSEAFDSEDAGARHTVAASSDSDSSENEPPFMSVYQRGAEHMMRVHGRADFVVRDGGHTLACLPVADTPWPTVEQLIVDQVLPRMLQLLGRPCLHASAVSTAEGVTALVGETGRGKSTLSAALCERGCALVCDDCLALQLQDGQILVQTGYPSVRLWPDSAEAMLGSDHQLPFASPRTTKLRKVYPSQPQLSQPQPSRSQSSRSQSSRSQSSRSQSSQPAPLAAARPPLVRVVLLQPDERVATPQIERLRPREGFAALTATLHRLTPEGSAVLAAEFRLLSAIAERVPVLLLRYRQDYAQLSLLVDTVLAAPAASTP